MNNKLSSALRLSFIGDSLAMPAHWFYDRALLKKAFPDGLRVFLDPPEFHPNSIMSLHSTVGGGRGSRGSNTQDEVVGKVILKGKDKFWGMPNMHYHKGLVAGDNTLNSHCLRVLMRYLSKSSSYNSEEYLRDYVEFMTETSVDTYAESYHREFFKNYLRGVDIVKCGGSTHDTGSIGGLVQIGLLASFCILKGLNAKEVCREHLLLTHPSEELALVSDQYVDVIESLLACSEAKLPFSKYVSRDPEQVVGPVYSTACYISDSWPSIIYLANKYREEPIKALQVNAELGGDNCHRGAVLGFILGLINPEVKLDLFSGLTCSDDIEAEISALQFLT